MLKWSFHFKPIYMDLFCMSSFCMECVSPLLKDPNPKCPTCRGNFKKEKVKKDKNLASLIKKTQLPCCGCNTKVRFDYNKSRRLGYDCLKHKIIFCTK